MIRSLGEKVKAIIDSDDILTIGNRRREMRKVIKIIEEEIGN